MARKSYANNFKDTNINIINLINKWPDDLDQNDVLKFVNLKKAPMIFVPVELIKNNDNNNDYKISQKYFYCSMCSKWLKINASIKDIKKHSAIHVPEHFKQCIKNKDQPILANHQENDFVKNIIGYILFETEDFASIESPFLTNISNKLPNRKKLLIALKNLAKQTQKEIATQLASSSCNFITFDEWTDSQQRKYLGITLRALMQGCYKDYFLDFIYLIDEYNSAPVLQKAIEKSLRKYCLTPYDITSCTTDNTNVMVNTSEFLDIWRIPCILHILNLIFQEFILAIKNKISPIFKLISSLTSSTKYQSFIDRKNQQGIKIKKVPSYSEVRWTSFCECILTIYKTKDYINEFLHVNNCLSEAQSVYLQQLQKICKVYKVIMKTYEGDSFGASSCFLLDIYTIKQLLTELEGSDLSIGSTNAKLKIDELEKTHQYFWHEFSPVATILNPRIVDYHKILTIDQIEKAKESIIRRMRKYDSFSSPNKKNTNTDAEDSEIDESYRFSIVDENERENEEVMIAPLQELLEKRSSSITDVFQYWKTKMETESNQLAMVALEILGILVTSVSSERSFSKSRYIINCHRTNLLPQHAAQQMIIRCSRYVIEGAARDLALPSITSSGTPQRGPLKLIRKFSDYSIFFSILF